MNGVPLAPPQLAATGVAALAASAGQAPLDELGVGFVAGLRPVLEQQQYMKYSDMNKRFQLKLTQV